MEKVNFDLWVVFERSNQQSQWRFKGKSMSKILLAMQTNPM
jgi:hypothetical protein